MAMRAISMTDCYDFDFEGKVLQNALALGDADNDGLNELIVGNEHGEIAIFKGTAAKPTWSARICGVVSAVAVGDVLNVGRNVVVAITTCGQCNLYEVEQQDTAGEGLRRQMRPFHTQRIPANVKVVLVGDVSGDGMHEVVVGLTDHVVRTFRWDRAGGQAMKFGKLVGLNKWELAKQIGAITLHRTDSGRPCILVSQPSGVILKLISTDSSKEENTAGIVDESISDFPTDIATKLLGLANAKQRNSVICGNLVSDKNSTINGSNERAVAVATLDGTVALVRDGHVLWRQSVDNELFAVGGMDESGTGGGAIVACAWDGATYLVSQQNSSDSRETGVRFDLGKPVSAFTAGLYGVGAGGQSACLVYATFCNRILLYYGVHVPTDLPPSLGDVLSSNSRYRDLLYNLGIKDASREQLKSINEKLLYCCHS